MTGDPHIPDPRKVLKSVRGHVYPRPSIAHELETGRLRPRSTLIGMLGVIVAILIAAHLVMLIAGA